LYRNVGLDALQGLERLLCIFNFAGQRIIR
jgi:hypothetical protein